MATSDKGTFKIESENLSYYFKGNKTQHNC